MKYALILSALLFSGISYSQSWQAVGPGNQSNSTHGLLTWNGLLVDLGSFNNNPCDRVATWDGTSWSCLAGGVGIVARAGVVWDGKLVVVGDFWNNFQPCVGCNGVAVWDGVSWSPLGNGVNNDVLTCTVWNNELVIGGDMTQADGVPIARIAKWNGTTWESVGPIGSFDNDIRCMTEFEGDLWIGGDFNNVGGQGPLDGLVKYDEVAANWVGGNSGVDLIGGVNESVRVLYVNPNDGNLYLGGEFPELWDGDAPAQDFNMSGIAMYDGSNWTPLGTGLNEYCRAMHEYNGDIVAGGYFTNAGGTPANKIAKWDGTNWTAMGQGFDAVGVDEYVKAATVWNGIYFAGGAYTQAEGNPMNYIAQWYEPATAAPVAWMTTSTTQLCGSGCVEFLDNSTNAPTTWNWSFPGSGTPTSTAQDPGQICYSSPGTYTATLQACNGIGCTTQNIDIEVTAGATVSSNDESICGGGPVTLTANPSISGGTYFWAQTAETTGSIVVNPAVTTSYTVTYSYLGCVSQSISTVTVGVGPNVIVNVPLSSICEGEMTTLTAVPDVTGGTYLWSPGGETTESINVSPLVSTDYTCEYTLGGCASTPVISTITVTATPTVTIADAAICGGGSGTLTAVPSVGGGTYLWSPGSQTTASITESPGSTTSYSVVYTLNGCPSTSEAGTITVGTTPTIAVADEAICEGETVTLSGTPSAGGGTYLWTPTNETTATIDVAPAGTSSYDVVYTLSGCPSNTETINVIVTPTPTVTVADQSICSGGSATLTAVPSIGGGTYLWSPGSQTTASITESPGSTTSYSVVYTLNGCPSTSESATITVNAIPTIAVTDETICEGETVTLSGTPSVGGGTYLWTPTNETTATIDVSPASTSSYDVVYTLAGCPSNTETINVIVNPTPTVTVTDQSICSGGSATLTAVPSVGGGTYLWSPGSQTTASITESPGSTTSYSVVYTLNGCPSASEPATITVTTTPTLAVSDETICEGETVTLAPTPSAGGGTYLWTPTNETTPTIDVSPAGTSSYDVAYTLSGCPSTTETIIVTVNPLPTVSTNNTTICEGESTTLTATPGTSGGTYLWNPGGQTTQSIVVSPAASTDYTVEYTLNGCTSVATISSVTVNTTPTVTVADQSICSGGSGTLTAVPSVGGGIYLWSPGSQTTASITESPGSTTSYSVVYTLNGCPSASEPATINVTTTPTIAVTDETICEGETVTLSGTPSAGGGTYLWTPTNETTATIDVSPASTSSYDVTYTLNGCPSTAETITVTVNPAPTVSTNNTTICEGESTTLTATPGTSGGTYLWNPGGQTTQSITVSPAASTSYTVEYTLNGCTSVAMISSVTVNAIPTVTIADQSICSGGSGTLTAVPSVGGGTYLWSPSSQTTASITESPGSTTSYSVVYTLNGCTSTSEAGSIIVTTTPTLTVNDETICDGETVTLAPTPSAGGGTYLWTPTNETTPSIDVSPASTSSYDVTYTLNGCPSTAETINVTVNPTPTVSTNNTTICEGESTTLTATPGTSGGTYLWSPGNQTTPSITVSPVVSTDYTVEYTLNGCTSSAMISSVTVNIVPTITIADQSMCAGASAVLTAMPSVGGGTYLWSPGSQTTASITESPGSTTSYSVVYTLNGCPSTSESGTINVVAAPTLTVNDETICEGETVTLAPTPSAGGGTYLWTPTNETTASIDVSPAGSASYTVEYTLNGCPSTSETINVTVNPVPTVSSNNTTICDGESTTLTATPSAGGGTYLWSPGNETTPSISVSPSTSTVYTVEYTLNGCTSLAAVSAVTVNAIPTVTIADVGMCSGGSGTLTAIPSAGGGTYLWSPGNQTTASITESPGSTTSYSVVYTLNGCPSVSEAGTISVISSPTLAVNDETICEGETVTLTPTPSAGGGTYLWTPTNETTPSIDVSPANSTSYDVSYTLNGCASIAETINITVNPVPTVASNNTTICDGESTTLTATPGTSGGTYLWSPGNETTPTITVSPSTSTDYTVEYTLNGCTSLPAISSVTVNPTPIVTVADEAICGGGSATLTAVPDLGGGTYLWFPGNQTTPTITESPGSTTSYSVVYTLNGCPSASAAGTINVGTTPTLTVTDETICFGETVTLTPTPSAGGGTYLWSPNSETTPTIDVSPSGTTSFDVVYTLNGCPSATESITVNVNPVPTVSANSATICEGESTTLTATPGTAGGTYLWSPGNETTPTITVSPSTTTTYPVEYTLNGCTSTPEVGTVTVNPTPTVTLNDIDLCDNAAGGTLDATPSLPGGTYLWTPGGETTPSISVPTISGTYSVVYTLNGCPSATEAGIVNIMTSPGVAVTEVSNEITADQGGATYQWLDCDNGYAVIPGETGQTFIPTANGNYAVQVNLTGCVDTSACTTISTIGIDELGEFNVTVYPNPTTGFIYISDLNEADLNYELIDLMGKVVMKGRLDSDNMIDLKDLADGTYTLHIDGKMKTRIVKQ